MEKEKEQTCRVCGRTQNNACPGGCSWVEKDLCSACEEIRKQLPGLKDDKDQSARAYIEIQQQKESYETGISLANARKQGVFYMQGRTTMKKEPTCRVCGCTQSNACPGGCHWVEKDLCSACERAQERAVYPIAEKNFTNFLSQVIHADSGKCKKDVLELGIAGFLASVDTLQYPEEVTQKIKDMAEFSRLLEESKRSS